MTDTGARRHHPEVVEGLLAPAQKLVALLVALHLDGDVVLEGRRIAVLVHHYRVVDDQVHRRQRVDQGRVFTRLLHRLAHGGQVHHPGHPGEVLHQHPGRAELDFRVGAPVFQPLHHGIDVGTVDRGVVFVAQQVLHQYFQGERQAVEIAQGVCCLGQAVVVVRLATRAQGGEGIQAVFAW